VDITHEVAPQGIAEGILALEAAALFPAGTVHVAVVDPGVGSARRGLVVESAGQVYVGPDNGLLSGAFAPPGWQAFELVAAEFRRPVVSRTFHGRDVFAPAAAHLALGLGPARFGPPVVDPVRVTWPAVRVTPDGVQGLVIHVDRFGNLITTIRTAEVEALGAGGPLAVGIGRQVLPLVAAYADLAAGAPGALIGSRGRLEVAVRDGHAARALRAGPGTPVRLSRTRATSSRRRHRRRT
jgi:S-adenosylmethionine hydrolase